MKTIWVRNERAEWVRPPAVHGKPRGGLVVTLGLDEISCDVIHIRSGTAVATCEDQADACDTMKQLLEESHFDWDQDFTTVEILQRAHAALKTALGKAPDFDARAARRVLADFARHPLPPS